MNLYDKYGESWNILRHKGMLDFFFFLGTHVLIMQCILMVRNLH
jgi:hypothetical protein